MDSWDFKKWRKQLRLNQSEAAQMLSISRGAVYNWESERTPIPYAVELACCELTRRWKQRPDFGPVILVYADGPMWQQPGECQRTPLQCESHADNASAIEQACRLGKDADVVNALVMEENFGVVWTCPELQRECQRRTCESGATAQQTDGAR